MGLNLDFVKMYGAPGHAECPECGKQRSTWFRDFDPEGWGEPNKDGLIEVEYYCEECDHEWGVFYSLTVAEVSIDKKVFVCDTSGERKWSFISVKAAEDYIATVLIHSDRKGVISGNYIIDASETEAIDTTGQEESKAHWHKRLVKSIVDATGCTYEQAGFALGAVCEDVMSMHVSQYESGYEAGYEKGLEKGSKTA
jgi:hypothetical protein